MWTPNTPYTTPYAAQAIARLWSKAVWKAAYSRFKHWSWSTRIIGRTTIRQQQTDQYFEERQRRSMLTNSLQYVLGGKQTLLDFIDLLHVSMYTYVHPIYTLTLGGVFLSKSEL